MPFSVAVLDEVNHQKLTPVRATELCAAAFSARNLDVERLGEVSVALVDLSTIHELNLKYREVNTPTDVLSFEIDGPYGEMVGEVVVAPEYVHFEETGVEELVVHGALHLAGMGHGDEFEGTEMAVVQEAVLRDAGVREG
ncbi:MAG TPA: rRNA maturation RNase YbeY [Rubrobacteraceae bacterium]|nr:rRNA maturation RNase YbeY [Rubrobacteraceae bacterium]